MEWKFSFQQTPNAKEKREERREKREEKEKRKREREERKNRREKGEMQNNNQLGESAFANYNEWYKQKLATAAESTQELTDPTIGVTKEFVIKHTKISASQTTLHVDHLIGNFKNDINIDDVKELMDIKVKLKKQLRQVQLLINENAYLSCPCCNVSLVENVVLKYCGHFICMKDYARLAKIAMCKQEDMKCPMCKRDWGWCGDFILLQKPTRHSAGPLLLNWPEELKKSDNASATALLHEEMKKVHRHTVDQFAIGHYEFNHVTVRQGPTRRVPAPPGSS